jgi:hypothetical protein
MSRRRKLVFGIVGGIVAIAVIGTIVAKFYLFSKEQKAIQLAQEYLAQKYEQEMQYQSVRYSWVDPGLYHVYFTSTDTGVNFEVEMWPKALDLPKGTVDYDGYLGDTYFSSFFCQKTAEYVLPNIKNIWGENAYISVVLHSGHSYPSEDISSLSENMTEKEMERFYTYEFSITSNCLLDGESKTEESQRVLSIIETIRKLDYSPVEIRIWYKTGKDEKEKVLTDSKTWTEMYISFDNWEEIISIEEIVNAMNEQWFSKFGFD